MPIKFHKVLSLGMLAICILITGCDDEPEQGSIAFTIEATTLAISPSISTIESSANDDGNKTFENSNGFLGWDKVDVGEYTFSIVARIYTYDDNFNNVSFTI